MEFNFNALCKVKLNDFGKKVWLSQIELIDEEVKEKNPLIVEEIKNKILCSPDGIIEMELWKFMNLFGSYMSPTRTPFAETHIDIRHKPIPIE